MLRAMLDAVMARRARALVELVRPSLPAGGPVLDLGSGTGHLAAELERTLGREVVTADVSDIHVVGRPPLLISDGVLPFADATFAAALLVFMLAYPGDPGGVLAEARRVTRGPIVLVQTVYANRFGQAWHRGREFVWTVVAFHVSRLVGYVPRTATFSMRTRRFYTPETLRRDVASAGLRIVSERERSVLPGRSLRVVTWTLAHDA